MNSPKLVRESLIPFVHQEHPLVRELGLNRAAVFYRQVVLCFDTHVLVERNVTPEDLDVLDASFGRIGAVDGEAARKYRHHLQPTEMALAAVKRVLLATVANRVVALLKMTTVAYMARGKLQKVRQDVTRKCMSFHVLSQPPARRTAWEWRRGETS